MPENELNEEDLFNDAVEGETADAPLVTEQTEQTEQKTEPEQAETAETEAETEEPGGRVPSFRLKQEAEARRQLETDLANERADKAALRQRLEALERPKVEPKAEDDGPDPLLDPKAYKAAVKEELKQEILNERREESLVSAREADPKAFDEAYQASLKAMQSGDVAIRARMQASRNPGKTLLDWHNEQKARAEVGTDLTAYKAKLRDEALKDPEFRKAAMAAWEVQPQSNGRPRVDLPPSLNGASRSGAALRADGDISDRELFEQTTG